MPISAPDVTRLRSAKHRIELVLNAVPLIPGGGGFSAQINQSTFSYPLGQLTVDNAVSITSSSLIGQAISIGTNSADPRGVTWGVIRKIINSTTLAIDAKSLGDSGYAQDIRQQLADNQYIKIYSHRPPWGLLSRISGSAFFKQFDIAYTDQGSSPAPVAVIGPHRQAFVNTSTNKAQLAFDATRSFAWGSKTITGYSWSLNGGTLISGSLTGSTLTGEFNPGFYIISCTVTDSASKTHTAYRYVFINTRTGKIADRGSTSTSLPYGYLRPWEITSDRQDRTGRTIGLTIYGNLTPSTNNYTFTAPVTELYPGQGFLITEYAYYNDEALADESVHVSSFFGYISDADIAYNKGVPSTSIVLHSPMELANKLPAATQLMTEVTSPTNWTQVTNALSNPAGAAWYILQHHAPNLLTMHDFIVPAEVKTLRKQSFVFQSDNIGGQLDQLEELMLGNIGCRSDGSIVLSQSPMYMDNTARNALENKYSWTEADVRPPLNYPRKFQVPVGQSTGYAFSFNGGAVATPYASLAPGKSQGQGPGKVEKTFIVRQSEGQTRVNEVTGHILAEEARVTDSFTTDANRNIDIVEPCDLNVWHTMVIPVTYDPMRIGWSNKRVIPISVSRQYPKMEGGISKRISHEWQPESFGFPGITIPVERGGAETQTLDDGTIIDTRPPYDPVFANAYALAWNGVTLGRTSDFNSSAPHWENINVDLIGNVNDVALDFGSEYLFYGVGALGAWVVTTSTTNLRVYYTPNLRTVLPVWTLQKTYTMADTTVSSAARIASSKTAQDSVIVAWKDGTGTQYGRTTNGGASWSSAAYVDTSITDDVSNNNAEIGLCVDGTIQLVTAADGTGGYYLYIASTFAGSFAKITGSPTSAHPFPFVTVDASGRAFTRAIRGTMYLVTFDLGGYTYGMNQNSGTAVLGTGLSGNGAKLVVTPPVTNFMAAGFDLPANQTIPTGTIMSFDWKIKWTGTPHGGGGAEQVVAGGAYSASVGGALSGGSSSFGSAFSDFLTNVGAINDVWQHFSVTVAAPISNVRSIAARVDVNMSSPTITDYEIYIDNVKLDLSSTIYRIDAYFTTPSWVNITPATGYEPSYPFAFSVDNTNNNKLMMVGENPTLQHRLISSDSGANWSDHGSTPEVERGAKISNKVQIIFGAGQIRYSQDEGVTYTSKIGDWGDSIGTIGNIRGMWVLI